VRWSAFTAPRVRPAVPSGSRIAPSPCARSDGYDPLPDSRRVATLPRYSFAAQAVGNQQI